MTIGICEHCGGNCYCDFTDSHAKRIVCLQCGRHRYLDIGYDRRWRREPRLSPAHQGIIRGKSVLQEVI
jgi:hypothetical protein